MSFFECCHHCKAPKRHPGCHDKCPEYQAVKKDWDKIKETERKQKNIESWTSPAILRAIRRKQRHNRKQY